MSERQASSQNGIIIALILGVSVIVAALIMTGGPYLFPLLLATATPSAHIASSPPLPPTSVASVPTSPLANSPVSAYHWIIRHPGVLPSRRGNYGLAYDIRRNVTVLFGGATGSTLFGDTWEWNGDEWLERRSVLAPSARQNPAMDYDAQRGVVVLFGGKDQTGHLNDTWEYDGLSWRKIPTVDVPSPRRESCVAYDPVHGYTVLFGGFDEGGYYNDTWTFDGSAWTLERPRHAPAGRRLCAMTYDSQRAVTVLFGGWSDVIDGGAFDDTWEWNGIDWIQKFTAVRPDARAGHALVYQSKLKKTILFGGDSGACGKLYQDTWVYNGSDWQQLDVELPGTHSVITGAYSPVADTILLFGGWAGGDGFCQVNNSLYEFSLN